MLYPVNVQREYVKNFIFFNRELFAPLSDAPLMQVTPHVGPYPEIPKHPGHPTPPLIDAPVRVPEPRCLER